MATATRTLELTVSPAPATKRTVTPADLRYLGGFRLPKASGGYSTGYSAGLFALRRGDGRLRAFSGVNLSPGQGDNEVYEVEVPEPSLTLPLVPVLKHWGDIYKGKRLDGNGEDYGAGKPIHRWDGYVTGLRWDEQLGGLLWNYGKYYAQEDRHLRAPSVGLTRFFGDLTESYGPWRPVKDGRSWGHWSRGGSLRVPKAFADKYLSGNTLAVGFGGPYAGIGEASAGPCLLSIADMLLPGGDYTVKPILSHDPWPNKPPLEARRTRRPEDYRVEVPDYVGTPGGYWTAFDEIGSNFRAGACHWLDTPTLEGLMFWTNQATGLIKYVPGGLTKEGEIERLYVYPTSELEAIATGRKQPWEATPTWYDWKMPASANRLARVCGVAFDAVESRLYLCCNRAWAAGEEQHPAVFVYQV